MNKVTTLTYMEVDKVLITPNIIDLESDRNQKTFRKTREKSSESQDPFSLTIDDDIMYNVDDDNCEDRDNHNRDHNNRGSRNDHGDHNNCDDFDDEELQPLTRKEFRYTMKLIDDKINSLYRLSKFMGTEQQQQAKSIKKLIAADELSEDFWNVSY